MNRTPSRSHVLLIDDDVAATEHLAHFLSDFGFEVSTATGSASALARLSQEQVDLVVMDIALSRDNGLALLQEIGRATRIPVVVLSRRTEPTDRIIGLELGADDYMGKPFEPRELLARMRAILRRQAVTGAPQPAQNLAVQIGRWELRRDERRLVAAGTEAVALSASEYRLLSAFMAAPRTVLSRQHLMSKARGRDMRSLDRGIDLLVSRLRRKLEDDISTTPLIRTVRGCGYIFEPPGGRDTVPRGMGMGWAPSAGVPARLAA